MKTTKFLSLAALALMFTACSNDDDFAQLPAEQPVNNEITITAQLAPKSNDAQTRAVSDQATYIKADWAVNEHIAILYEVSSVKKVADATITAVDGSGKATISFAVDGGTPNNTACTLVYPLSAAKDDYSGVKDAATLLAAQDGTLSANLDVRVGAGTIQTTTPGLTVTTQPAAQFAIFKFTTKNNDGSADINVRPLTITIGTQNYVITPASATNVLYVALPAVSSQAVSFKAESNGKFYACSKASVTFDKGKFYQSPLKMATTGALTGKFTINSSGNKVYFSQGNLQATTSDLGTNWTWAFAANQWDYIGGRLNDSDPASLTGNNYINGNGTVSTNGTVDLFGWVGNSSNWKTGAAKYGISNSEATNDKNGYGNVANENLKSDWGNTMGTGWRTLTNNEWEYLFSFRASGSTVNGTSNARYTHAIINTDGTSVKGVILFPDGVTIINSEATSWGSINGNSSWGTRCTSAQWIALAAKGCVFLPAAGSRRTNIVYSAGEDGDYWSSSYKSAGAEYACFMSFESKRLKFDYTYRYIGRSVRLVRAAE